MARQKPFSRAVVAGLVFVCAVRYGAGGQEFSFGLHQVAPRADSSYSHRFAPPYEGGAFSSLGAQDLKIKGKSALGWNGALVIFLWKKAGVQLMLDHFMCPLQGKNSPYEVSLNYAYPGPQDSVKTSSFQRSSEWPDTDGDLRQLTVSLNGVIGLFPARRISLLVSGGLSYFDVKGTSSFIGFTKFRYTGNSTLAIQDYKLAYEFSPDPRIGFNAGAEAAYRVYRNIAIFLEFRYYGCRDIDAPLHITADKAITEPLDELEKAMSLGSMKINPSFSRIGLGLRFRI